MAYNLNKYFQNTRGMDLRSSDLVRAPGSATEMVNAIYRQTGALSKRPGYQFRTDAGDGGLGIVKFNNTDINTGVNTEEIYTVDNNLHKIETYNLDISYTGSTSAYINLYLDDDNQFKFEVYEDNTLTNTWNLGTGRGASDLTATQLKDNLNALTDFTASITGGAATPAAFIPVQRNITITTNTLLTYRGTVAISTPSGYSNPFATHFAARGDNDFENASFAQFNDVLYIANGYDDLHKYDGTRVYKAGLPKPDSISSGLVAGSLNGTYKYKITFEHTDGKENYLEGATSDEITVTPATNGVNITYTSLLNTSGFDTDSTDLKVNLYRTKNGGSIFYLVESITNGSTFTTDNTADSALVLEYNIPVKTPSLPPKCRYIDVWRSQLVMTGNRESVNTVYYSDVGNEFFPLDQSFITTTRTGGGNTAVKALDNALFVFKNESILSVSGDFGTDSFTVDNLSDSGIGCVAHATIQEIEGKAFFLGKQGIYSLNNQGVMLESDAVDPRFDDPYVRKRCTSYYWVDREVYMVLLPVLQTGGLGFPYLDTTNSTVIVYDKFRRAFYEWKNINMLGGMAEQDDNIFISGIDLEPISASSKTYIAQVLDTKTSDDYADHEQPTSFTYKSHWEAMGEPSIYKKFLRIKVHALDGSINDFEVDKFNIDIETEHDYDPIAVSSLTLDFSGGAAGWGLSGWDEFPWGESRLEQLRSRLAARKAKSLRVVFKNSNLHENILISGYELEVAAPYDLQLKE